MITPDKLSYIAGSEPEPRNTHYAESSVVDALIASMPLLHRGSTRSASGDSYYVYDRTILLFGTSHSVTFHARNFGRQSRLPWLSRQRFLAALVVSAFRLTIHGTLLLPSSFGTSPAAIISYQYVGTKVAMASYRATVTVRFWMQHNSA